MAPCLLIFEDIDSLVSPAVRSYFLNEVDGLESNHGILMIGSTNHLERLDPGIAKRPSRFDRKYIFENPSKGERVQYAEYWREKLKGNNKVNFPEVMSAKVADLTGGFSFAYMKEAFVAALLVIVAREDKKGGGGDGLSDNLLWKELKKQIEALRKEMEGEDAEARIENWSNGPGIEAPGSRSTFTGYWGEMTEPAGRPKANWAPDVRWSPGGRENESMNMESQFYPAWSDNTGSSSSTRPQNLNNGRIMPRYM